MITILSRPLGYAGAFLASILMALTTGCASGGFKLTRTYAQFVNRQMIIIRIVLYILTSIVFAVTMMIDLVIFNTIDFWEGRVSAGEYNFTKGEQTFHARHEVVPATQLKRSTIQIFDKQKTLQQTVVLQETTGGEVELFVDGKLRTKVRDLAGLPMMAMYDATGTLQSDKLILVETSVPVLHLAAKQRVAMPALHETFE